MITLLILYIGSSLQAQSKPKSGLINRFCIASLKSKFNFKNKQESLEDDWLNKDFENW